MAILSIVIINFKYLIEITSHQALTLDLRRAVFRIFGELVSKTLLETTYEGIMIHQCWSLFKYHLLRAQE